MAAAKAAERAAAARNEQEERKAMMEVIAHREAIRVALLNQTMSRMSGVPHAHERLPLRAEGDDFAHIESRIPNELFWHLLKQPNFGWEGLTSDEGQRDLRRDHPVCRVKTVSGRIVSGPGSKSPPRRRVRFGRGTITFAN